MIVAEIGQNHMGSMELARQLIDSAQTNGADLVKFQLYDSQKLYGEYQYTELKKDQAFSLFDYGKTNGIKVFFSVFDTDRVKWCIEMGCKYYKIAHSQRTNHDVINAIPRGAIMFISTDSVEFEGIIQPQDKIFYCIPRYPAEFKSINWDFPGLVLFAGKRCFEGFSDHTIGLDAARVALTKGVEIIEKHFAIDHNTGVDAEWSMTPSELKELKRFEMAIR